MGWIESATKAYELAKKAGNVEAQEAIMQLREEIVAKSDEVLRLRQELANIQLDLNLAHEVHYEAPYYWRVSEKGREGPFCQLCFDKDKTLIRLQRSSFKSGLWHCTCCDNSFRDCAYVEDREQGVTWGR